MPCHVKFTEQNRTEHGLVIAGDGHLTALAGEVISLPLILALQILALWLTSWHSESRTRCGAVHKY
jgi:hypothetical protein